MENLILNYKIVEAFWALAEKLEDDLKCRKYFIRLVGLKNNIGQLRDEMDRIHALADQGNPFMQYAYARFHDCLAPEKDSPAIAWDYYSKAIEAGIADARAYRAFFFRDGDLDEFDHERYVQEMEIAENEGSEKAREQHIRNVVFGTEGERKDPELALDMASSIINKVENTDELPNPMILRLMGNAEFELGRREKAWEFFQQAVRYGDSGAYFQMAFLFCSDADGTITDKEKFNEIMDKAHEVNASESAIQHVIQIDQSTFDELDEDSRRRTALAIKDELTRGWLLGEGGCPYLLGNYYSDGSFGFEQDYAQAWIWYSRGAALREPSCYARMAELMLDGLVSVEDADEEYAYLCQFKAYQLGDEDMLLPVCEAYEDGHLARYADIIENVCIPKRDEIMAIDDMEDEHECEIGEDDWSSDPDIDLRFQTCCECVETAEKRIREQQYWNVSQTVNKYLDIATQLLDMEMYVDELYGTNDRLLELIYDRPRLKLRLYRFQLDVLTAIEMREDHDLGLTEDLRKDIALLEKNITLADEGRLDEIPQTGHLRKDSVEWTAKWEEAIDEAERIAYSRLNDQPRGMGFCFAYWAELRDALMRFGVEWRDPHMMNPRVMFD